MPGDLCTAYGIISSSPLSLATDVTDVTFGASGILLGTRTGAGGTATLAKYFLAAVHGSMDNRCIRRHTSLKIFWLQPIGTEDNMIFVELPWPFLYSSFSLPYVLCDIITLITMDRGDWRETRGKWRLTRKPDWRWWHCHTSIRYFFWPQTTAPWTQK